ncbi:MAG: Fibronectin type protein [Pseudonocardiales bacterium]|nr:Fibronectin type protein [Pseudonocardiales bacterium]
MIRPTALAYRPARTALLLVVVAAVAGSAVVVGARAATPPHVPFGHVDVIRQAPTGIAIGGWAIDPDSTAPIHVDVYVDGHGTRLSASASRSDIARRYPTYGTAHGFGVTLPAAQGVHTVCVYAINVSAGNNVGLACERITINYNPIGQVESVKQTTTGFTVAGWALDPNTPDPIHVDVYLDGKGTRLTATGARPDLAARYPGSGTAHGFAASFPGGQGTHSLCVYAINVGAGTMNPSLGCRPVVLDFNPHGQLDWVHLTKSGISLAGWAADPNSAAPVSVDIYVDGGARGRLAANLSRPDVAAAHPGIGANRGFATQINLPEGRHGVCAYAINIGLGSGNPRLGCQSVTIDYKPRSGLDVAQQHTPGVHVTGWSVDPDTSAPIKVVISANGRPVGTLLANRPGGTHSGHMFDGIVAVNNGTYRICATGVNVLQGSGTPMSACRNVTLNFDPFGAFDAASRDSTGKTVRIGGWAIDPDVPTTPLSLAVTIDGRAVANAVANAPRADVGRRYSGTGTAHGLSRTYPVNEGEHKICVTAINRGNGVSKALGCRILNALHPTPPSAPTAVAATGSYGSATVSWRAPSSDGGAPWSGYTVTASPGGASVTVGAATTTALVANLKSKTRYTFTVVATNVAGRSAAGRSPAVTTQAGPPPQTTPAPISTSRYVRNISGGSSADLARMRAEGAADARANPSGHSYLVLLDIGGQDQVDGGVMLSATTRFVSYADLVKNVNAYVDGYASQQKPSAPAEIAIGTNNDMDVSSSSGVAWARAVVNPVVTHSAGYRGIVVAGANDIEPGFRGTYAQTRAWLLGYLGATRSPFVFNGSADGCAWTVTGRACNNGWNMAGLYSLSAGAAPTRIVNLPQIYNNTMAAQWKFISLTGVAAKHPKINFGGALTEWTACAQTGTCGSLTGNNAWTQMWRQLQSHPALKVGSLPYSTDLRIDR